MIQAFKIRLLALLSCGFLALTLISCGGSPSISTTRTLASANQGYSTDDLYRFFAVAFGAAPGVTYMGQLIEAAEWGLSIKEIVNIFTTKSQFTDTYPLSMSKVDFATKLVNNVVGASANDSAKQEAINDIVSALSLPNWTRGDVIYAVFNNLANKPESDTKWYGTAKKMANQVAHAKYFTEVLKEDTTELSALRYMVASVDESTPAPMLPLAGDPRFLPNLKAKYDQLCGRDVNAQQIVPIDLNKDGRKDLIVALWCFTPTLNQVIDTPVKNAIIALIQNSDGTYRDATLEVFGSDLPDIGGIASAHTTHDFNNDGYTDVVFAMNREDGRGGTGAMDNFKSQKMSLMSNGNGTYRFIAFGDPIWGMTISSRIYSSGTKDVIISGYHGTNTGYRWVDNRWQEVEGYGSWVDNPLFLKADPNLAIQNGRRDELGIALFAANNATWSKVSSFSFSGSTKWVNQISWTGASGKVPVITIGGEDYINPGFAGFCDINTGGSTKVAAFMAGTIIVGGYRGGTLYENEGADPVYKYKPINRILLFSVKGSALIKDDVELDLSEDGTVPFKGIECNDLNSDGINDIHVTAARGWRAFVSGGPLPTPIVFFGQNDGSFKRVRAGIFPRMPDGSAAVFADLNSDAVMDLIYWPLTKFNGEDSFEGNDALIRSDSVRYKIYQGAKNINSLDLRP